MKHHNGIWRPEAPHLITRPTREMIIPKTPTPRVGGFFTMSFRDARNERLIKQFWFPNLITNGALDFIMSSAVVSFDSMTTWMAVGSGNTAPAGTDTQLETQLGARTNTNGTGNQNVPSSTYVAGPPDYLTLTKVRRFSTSQGNGTIREVGLFSASSGPQMLCRALLKDELGAPTEFVKDNTMVLDVAYEFRVYPPMDDVEFSDVDIGGSTYDILVRAINVAATGNGWRFWGQWGLHSIWNTVGVLSATSQISARTATTIGGTDWSRSLSSYTNGSFQRDATCTHASALGAVTVGQLGVMQSQGGSQHPLFQAQFTPAFVKPAINALVLVWRWSIARA